MPNICLRTRPARLHRQDPLQLHWALEYVALSRCCPDNPWRETEWVEPGRERRGREGGREEAQTFWGNELGALAGRQQDRRRHGLEAGDRVGRARLSHTHARGRARRLREAYARRAFAQLCRRPPSPRVLPTVEEVTSIKPGPERTSMARC